MTDKPNNKPQSVSLNSQSFVEEPLCNLSFEEALRIGAARSEKLKPQDFKETSILFCVDGLYKWYKSFSKHHHKGSVFMMVRDISWYWASFCETNTILTSLVREYFGLLKDITENTAYTDLADNMDEASRLEKIGKRRSRLTILIPFEVHGVVGDCAVATGIPFGHFYQTGMGVALAANSAGLYSSWAAAKVRPLFDEVMAKASARLDAFLEIRNTLEYREAKK